MLIKFPSVGYSAADVREVLRDTWAYMECAIGGDANEPSRSDFFGLNSYSWCGDATFKTSTYDQLVGFFSGSTIPTFFSEYGCNKVKPRKFSEVQALYGPQMTVLSGGLVYEYSQEEADYGLVQINGNGSISLFTDFDNLQSQYNKVNVTLLETTNSTATSLKPPTCGTSLIQSQSFDKNFTLPATQAGSLINDGVPGAKQGKIVTVSATDMPVAVYASNGKPISNLKLQQRSEQNVPGGSNTSGGTSGNGTSGTTKKGSAGSVSPLSALSMSLFAVLFGMMLL